MLAEVQEMAVTNQAVHDVPLVEPGATCDCAHVPAVPNAVPVETTQSVLHVVEEMRKVFVSTKLMSEFLQYAKVSCLGLRYLCTQLPQSAAWMRCDWCCLSSAGKLFDPKLVHPKIQYTKVAG
jgi:hypothetical protein